jgi:DNA-binding MarR family transcriptional regulator
MLETLDRAEFRRAAGNVDDDPLALETVPAAASLVHVTVERLFRMLKAQMSTTLEDCGSSIVEWRILLMLYTYGEMAQRDLVREVAMVQAQVSRTLTSMQNRNLVRTKRSDEDKRIRLFRLTVAGEALYQSITPAMARRKATLDSVLTAEEMQTFLTAARAIAASIHHHEPGR